MNGGREQDLIRIDVSDTGYEGLVEQHRLDAAAMFLQTLIKACEVNAEGIGTLTRDMVRHTRKIFESAELPNIVVLQRSVREIEERARELVLVRIPQQLPRHAQVDVQHPTIKLKRNLLAVTCDFSNRRSGKLRFGVPEILARHTV